MKMFRIILWAAIALIIVALGVTSYQWQSNTLENDVAFGVPFSLTDQNGDIFTDVDMAAKPTALFFGFTHCPEICPTTIYELNGWLKEVDPDGNKINAYFITVDPERDTQEVLKRYIGNVSDRIIGITGPLDKVTPVLKGYKVYWKKIPLDDSDPNGDYTMDHTASVYLLKKGGDFKGTISYGENPDTAIQKLKNLL